MNPVAAAALFGAGLSSFLAPCVLPLIPAYLGMMAGETGTQPSRSIRAAVWFVGGFSTVFVALGAVAGRVGGLIGFTDLLARAGGLAIIGFGLLLLAGSRLLGERRWSPDRWPSGSIIRPLVMGVTFGAAWTPCVGPFLGSALTLAASSGRAGLGAALLAVYAAGLGVPFLLAPLALAALPDLGARVARVAARANPIAAVLLVGLGVLMATGTYGSTIGSIVGPAAGGA